MNIQQIGDEFHIFFRYDPDIVARIKGGIPPHARRFDPTTKCWIVHTSAYTALQNTFQGMGVTIPAPKLSATATRVQTVRVVYVGKAKIVPATGQFIHNGTTGTTNDHGYVWDVVMSEKAVRAWFKDDSNPSLPSSFYALLGISQQASPDEIKSGYRRMARQWHPDVCHEEGANEVFLKITRAYEILTDPKTRARYDAGLRFEQIGDKPTSDVQTYAPPLRCGLITGKAQQVMGKTVFEEIMGWDDVIENGQVMVSSWHRGGIEINWTPQSPASGWKKG